MDLTLDTPVQFVPRIGPRMASLLKNLGVETVYQLMTHVPFRYNDYSLVSPVARVQAGETVTVAGTLEHISTFVTKNGKRLVTGRIRDGSGRLELIWFNQAYLTKVLHPGDTLSASGKVDWFGQKIVLVSPDYEVIKTDGGEHASLHTGRLVPVYPETEGVSSKWLRGRIAFVLDACLARVTDRLPEDIRDLQHLPDLREAIRSIHFPGSAEDAARARDRLAFDELFTLMLRSKLQKHVWNTTLYARPLPIQPDTIASFVRQLPFTLTPDQETAIREVLDDLSGTVPMNRLLEGDVGSGKTVVAAVAMFAAYLNGESSLLMAPTQILAQQHFETLSLLLKSLGIPIDLIIGGRITAQKSGDRKKAIPRVLVGTHALLDPDKNLPKPGLIVIDEQQRFGVSQRALLRKHAPGEPVPHQLILTATPIPRTITQTVFGNLDLSVLSTLPSGRLPVRTWVVPTAKRAAAYRWIEAQLTQTHSRAFVICPFIEESESMKTVRAVKTEFETVRKIFSTLHVGMLHGKLKPAEKTDALERLRDGRDDILVTTPVVEVGIDIPEATIIVIEAAERFGLSQLHQLRGRVGRSDKPSYCLLFTEANEDHVLTRLKALETVHNGPKLAELDLVLRGPGELFGTRQHGIPGFALAKLTDTQLVSRVRSAVQHLTDQDPGLSKFPYLREIGGLSTIETSQS